MTSESEIKLRWHGAAHYHITYKGKRIVIDPLYCRLPGDKPHLDEKREDVGPVDTLLLTHGHWDHSGDFLFVAEKRRPQIFAPRVWIRRLRRRKTWKRSKIALSKCHGLEDNIGRTFVIADDIELTALPIGTEQLDAWFMRDMFARPFRHRMPQTLVHGVKWLLTDVLGNCFAFHFNFGAVNKSMLYFGNLTHQLDGLAELERVDVLALPYCPANAHWIEDTLTLIKRFTPDVVLVHHFDNFMNPYTHSDYMSLEQYRESVCAHLPDTKFFYSKFNREVDLTEILG